MYMVVDDLERPKRVAMTINTFKYKRFKGRQIIEELIITYYVEI